MSTENTVAMEYVLDDIRTERRAQEAKWGEQNHPDGTTRGVFWPGLFRHDMAHSATIAKLQVDHEAKHGESTYAGILLEEVFESLCEDDPLTLRAELVQVAAVAVQWIEAIDRREAGEGR